MFYIYIIYSAKLDRYYVGYTADIEVRIVQHNSGLSSYTSKANDWKLVYKEQFTTREEAHKRELALKTKKAGNILNGWFMEMARGLACPESFRGRGRRFDSDILHALKPPSGGFINYVLHLH
jgi:putative endonuclease